MSDHDANATPRNHKRHQRRAKAGRVRHSKQMEEWLAVQAARLSTTEAVLFAKLTKYTAEQIAAAANLAAIP